MDPPEPPAPDLEEHRKTDRRIGWALATLFVCFVGYLAGVYFFQSQGEETGYVHESLPQDPPKPVEPFVWGSVPETNLERSAEANTGSDRADAAAASEAISSPASLPGEDVQEEALAFFAGPDLKRVRRETIRALRSGETQIWNIGDQRGYVLVSTARIDGTRECRQVSYTLFDGPLQSLSPAMQWCREGKGDWGLS